MAGNAHIAAQSDLLPLPLHLRSIMDNDPEHPANIMALMIAALLFLAALGIVLIQEMR